MARSSIGSEADESFWKPCNVVNWVLGKGGGGSSLRLTVSPPLTIDGRVWLARIDTWNRVAEASVDP